MLTTNTETYYIIALLVSLTRHFIIHPHQSELGLDHQLDVPNLEIESQTCNPNFDQNLISFNNDLNKNPVNLTDSEKSIQGTDIIEILENDEWFIEAVMPKKERSEGSKYGFVLTNTKRGIQETGISEIRQIMNELLPSEHKQHLFSNSATFEVITHPEGNIGLSLVCGSTIRVPLARTLSDNIVSEELTVEQRTTLSKGLENIEIETLRTPLLKEMVEWCDKIMPSTNTNVEFISLTGSHNKAGKVNFLGSPPVRPLVAKAGGQPRLHSTSLPPLSNPNNTQVRFFTPPLQAIRRESVQNPNQVKLFLQEKSITATEKLVNLACLISTYIKEELPKEIEQIRPYIIEKVAELEETSDRVFLKLPNGKPTAVGIVGNFHCLQATKNYLNKNNLELDLNGIEIDHVHPALNRASLLSKLSDTEQRKNISSAIFIDGDLNRLRTRGNVSERKKSYVLNRNIRRHHLEVLLETLQECEFLYYALERYGYEMCKQLFYRYALMNTFQVELCILHDPDLLIIADSEFGVPIHEAFVGLHHFKECLHQFSTNFSRSKDQKKREKLVTKLTSACQNVLVCRANVIFYIQCFYFETEEEKNKIIEAAINIIDSPLEGIIFHLNQLKQKWNIGATKKIEHKYIIDGIDVCLKRIADKDNDSLVSISLKELGKQINWQESLIPSTLINYKMLVFLEKLAISLKLNDWNLNYRLNALSPPDLQDKTI